MTAGLGVFAEIPIPPPQDGRGTADVTFRISPEDFTLRPSRSVWIRIEDVGPDGSPGPSLGTVVRTATTRRGPVSRPVGTIRLPGNVELVRVGYGDYTLHLGSGSAGGAVRFSLAGDATGAEAVRPGSLAAIRADFGARAGSARYEPAADVNGDGRIGLADLRIARANLGASTTLRPLGLSVTTATTPNGHLLTNRTVVVQTAAGASVTAVPVDSAASASATTDAAGAARFQTATLWVAPDGSENLSAFEVTVQASDRFGQSTRGVFAVPAGLAEGLGALVANEPAYNPANAPPASESDGPLPSSVDLTASGFTPPPFDQGQINSCVANAVAWDYWYVENKQGLADPITPSRAFSYYNSRVIEGTHPSAVKDEGTWVGAMVQTMSTTGVAPESEWPYSSSTINAAPPASAYAAAQNHRIIVGYQIDPTNLDQIKGSLAAGYPVVFAVKTTGDLSSATAEATGFIPTPKPGDSIEGGHAMVLVGYDDATRQFRLVNSWGGEWGAAGPQGTRGYGAMSYDYVTSPLYASGFYSIRAVS